MKKGNFFIKWLQDVFAPKMLKVTNNVWILSIKDSIMQALPLVFLGSVFAVLTIPGDLWKISWWPNFWAPFSWTFGSISLFVAFLIPFNLMEKKNRRKNRFVGGIASVVLFLMAINPQFMSDLSNSLTTGELPFYRLTGIGGFGAGGMLVAIICGLVAGFVVNLFSKFSFFKEESVIPNFVRSWFDSMLPLGIVTILGWVLTDASFLNLNLYQILVSVFMPLQNFALSPFGFVLILFIYCFIYSMGISSWILVPVVSPILLNAAQINGQLVEAGTATFANLNLLTDATIYSAYLWIGGIACTMPLVIMMVLQAKSKRLKALGKACIVPSIFNINEPVVFGAIAWNPILMVPMWLQGIILPILVYLFTKVIPFAPVPAILFNMWYTPFPISTWIVTQSIQGIILVAAVFVVSWLIWSPFFKVYDKQVCVEESGSEQA